MAKQKERRRRAVSSKTKLTIEGAAEYLGMSVRFVEKRKADGTLPYYKNGTAVRFSTDDLDEYLAKNRRVGR